MCLIILVFINKPTPYYNREFQLANFLACIPVFFIPSFLLFVSSEWQPLDSCRVDKTICSCKLAALNPWNTAALCSFSILIFSFSITPHSHSAAGVVREESERFYNVCPDLWFRIKFCWLWIKQRQRLTLYSNSDLKFIESERPYCHYHYYY